MSSTDRDGAGELIGAADLIGVTDGLAEDPRLPWSSTQWRPSP